MLATINEQQVAYAVVCVALVALIWWFIGWVGMPAPALKAFQIILAVIVILAAVHFLFKFIN